MPSVLFWTGQLGGTAEYRCLGPGRALAARGWDVKFADDGFDMTVDGRVKDDPDVLVLSRAMGDYLPDAVRRVRKAGRTLVVFDIDDWFAAVPGYNPASQLPPALVETMHQAMREADVITCSTPELAEGYAGLNRTIVLPNYLDPRIWEPFAGYRSLRPFLTVGWAGAFHWRTGDLDLLKPWLPEWLDEHPSVRFAAVGCPEAADYLGVEGITVADMPDLGNVNDRNRHLHPYPHLPAMLAHIDVGLVPLLPHRFNQAKSCCKGMEYNAMSIPAVASPSREYRTFIEPGVNGYLVRKNDWAGAVNRAFDNLDTLREGARRTAERYWIDDHIEKWERAYAHRSSLVHS